MESQTQIKITIDQLSSLLKEQRKIVGEYMSGNLSCYQFWNACNSNSDEKLDIEKVKEHMKEKAMKAEPPNDFKILKYLFE